MVSTVQVGSGRFTYEVNVAWAKLPPEYSWREAVAVAVGPNGEVYVFCRGDHPMIVFDGEGNFLRSWGEEVFTRAHGVTVAPDGTLYCTDDMAHVVRHCTPEGRVLATFGNPGEPAEPHSGVPFNRPTDVAIDPKTGDLYISDGYANSSVHKYSPDGRLLFSWGSPGTDPGQFNIVHNIATDKNGYVYVADRENHRVQIFDSSGGFETQWVNMHRPCAIHVSEDQNVYVGELGWGMPVNRNVPNIGPRVSVYDTGGELLARIGHLGFGQEAGQFTAPHGLSTDSKGNLYVGEVSWTNLNNLGQLPDRPVRSLQKLVKLG